MNGRGTIVILIDALGYEIVERHGFRPSGLSKPSRVETVLGFSQAALTTILTGLEPSRHGLWMMYSFAEGSSPFRWLRLVPFSSRRRLLRNAIRLVLDRLYRVESYYSLYSIPSEVFPYLDLPARRRMFAPGGSGAAENIFDELERRGEAWRAWDHTFGEEEAFDAIERSVDRGDGSFRLLYTAGLDSTMHRHGTRSEQTACHLDWYRDRIERIVSKTKGERVFLMGDHGMCDVERYLDLPALVGGLDFRVPEDIVPFYDSTMARFRVRTESAGERLRGFLSGLEGGRLLDEGEMKQLGVLFPDGRFGDPVFLVDAGTIILPSYMGVEGVSAMHGYHPDNACMYSALFSNVETARPPSSLDHIAGYVLPGFAGGDGT